MVITGQKRIESSWVLTEEKLDEIGAMCNTPLESP
jgi:hypothetical protein